MPDTSCPPGARHPARPAHAPRRIRGTPLLGSAPPSPADGTWHPCPARVPTRSCAVPTRSYRVCDSATTPLPTPVLVWALASTGIDRFCARGAAPCLFVLPDG